VIIMTSNIGARFIEKKRPLGFASSDAQEGSDSVSGLVQSEVKRTFNPEFINRIDEIIIFDALTDDDLARITRLLIEQLNTNLEERGIAIGVDDTGVAWLLDKTLKDRSYGARPLRRAIQRHIEDPLSECFMRGEIQAQLPIRVGVEKGALWYWQGEKRGELSA
jgi:ATP-dependent Clp protease ATP-binding subunit ClpC